MFECVKGLVDVRVDGLVGKCESDWLGESG